MSIQQLPHEILLEIFKTVHTTSRWKGEMKKCAIVCQAWHLPACRVLFERLIVKNINYFLQHMNSQNQYGSHCKTLHFSSISGELETSSHEYKQLFLQLPNLQVIILENSLYRTNHLSNIAQHRDLIKHVKEILFEGGWRLGELKSYHHCALAFKNTLQRLQLDSLDFTALTTLRIVNQKTNALNLPQLSMFQIMRLCPNLVSFSLDNNFQESDDNSINYNFDHSKLKYLELSLPEITKQHINYMVTNISQLKEFKLQCGSTEPIPWVEKFVPFQKYLACIKKVDLHLKGKFGTKSTEYLPNACNMIITKPSTPAHICLTIKRNEKSNAEKTILKKHMDSIYIYCEMSIKDFLSSSSPTPIQKIIAPFEMSKSNVQTFNIIFEPKSRQNITYELPLTILDIITSTFKSLKNFSINMDGYSYSSVQVIVASREIHGYEYRCMDYQYIMALQRRCILLSNKLAYVILKGVNSTQDITSTSKLLPHIRQLKLLDCNFTLDNKFNIIFDLDNLQLQLLEIDARSLMQEGLGAKTLVLEVEERRANRTLCYKWKRQ